MPVYIDECKSLGIDILKPDINLSELKFTVDNSKNSNIEQEDNSNRNAIGNIRFGLGSVKNVGIAPIEAIIKERTENGNFQSFTDFAERIADQGVNKKCIESLIKAGAFDGFKITRSTLLASFEGIIDLILSTKKKGLEGQFSMFDMGTFDEENNMKEIKYNFIEREEFGEKELLSQEKEMLGIYLSGHPLAKLKEEIEKNTTISSKDIMALDSKMDIENENPNEIEMQSILDSQKANSFKDGQKVKFAGIITSIKKKYTKNNKIMAFVTIEDLYGVVEVLTFENAYLAAKESLIEENIVMVKGRLSIRDEEKTTIIANEIKTFSSQKRKVLSINITNLNEETKKKLRAAIKYFNGEMNNIAIEVKENENIMPCGAIYLTEEILNVFKEIVGEENVAVREV